MRIKRIMLGCVCVIAVLMVGVLGGCGEPATDNGPVVMDFDDPEGTTAQIPEDAETFGDVIDTFTMPSSFRMVVEHGEDTQEIVMQMDGQQASKMRVEEGGVDGAEVFIMDFEGGEMISYNTQTNQGFRMHLGLDEVQDAPNPWDEYDTEARIVGSEVVNGVDCWVVEMDATSTVWVGKHDGLMRKVEDEESVTTFTITEVDEVPASVFEVPADIEITEMPMGDPAD